MSANTSEATKPCSKCGVEKPLSAFAKDKRKAFGRHPSCFDCNRERFALHYRGKYHGNEGFREAALVSRRARRQARPDKRFVDHKELARMEFHKAVARGDLVRPKACSDCGIECVPHGHHEDYSKPLDVIWVCRQCHGIRHRRYADKSLTAERAKEGETRK